MLVSYAESQGQVGSRDVRQAAREVAGSDAAWPLLASGNVTQVLVARWLRALRRSLFANR
jgi:hypothetical protein